MPDSGRSLRVCLPSSTQTVEGELFPGPHFAGDIGSETGETESASEIPVFLRSSESFWGSDQGVPCNTSSTHFRNHLLLTRQGQSAKAGRMSSCLFGRDSIPSGEVEALGPQDRVPSWIEQALIWWRYLQDSPKRRLEG